MVKRLEYVDTVMYLSPDVWVTENRRGRYVLGITALTAHKLQDIVTLDLPNKGEEYDEGSVLVRIESFESNLDVISPISGVVHGINKDLIGNPETILTDPFEAWLVEFTPKKDARISKLLSSDDIFDLLSPEDLRMMKEAKERSESEEEEEEEDGYTSSYEDFEDDSSYY